MIKENIKAARSMARSRIARATSNEQIETLRWAASLGAVTAEALALRLGVSVASARARLAAMLGGGLLTRMRPLADGTSLWVPTAAGRRACGMRGLAPARVSASNAHHLIVCALAAAALERRYPSYEVQGERELRRDERECKRALASARVHGAGGSGLHRPDLVLVPRASHGGEGLPVAVEVELTVKAPQRLREICRAWSRCRAVAGVLYVASDPAERAVRRALEGVPGDGVVVVPLSALGGEVGAG